tara:strand:+ start:219 stop:344 length:126 start_codon:yes stop_codon:yes gene_type:complete
MSTDKAHAEKLLRIMELPSRVKEKCWTARGRTLFRLIILSP